MTNPPAGVTHQDYNEAIRRTSTSSQAAGSKTVPGATGRPSPVAGWVGSWEPT
jgi:hypothetical protein